MAPETLPPLATASLPWQIVLAIIAFNVIAGLMAKRKQRPPKSDPVPGSQGDPKGDARRRLEEARARSAAEAERKAAERQADRERDEGRVSARPKTEAFGKGGSGRDAAAPAQDAGAKAKDAGRDLLGQLARELGLELPQAPKPPPAPRPAPANRPVPGSQPASASRTSPAQARTSAAGANAARKTAVREEAVREEEGSTSPAPIALAHPEPIRAASPLAFELADADALRKAFILKTVLDKPLSLRPRR
jgi:hypothetical protein